MQRFQKCFVNNSLALNFKWEVLKTKGGEHLHRSDHTANILGNYLYLFGGADKEEESTNELWMLDIGKLC